MGNARRFAKNSLALSIASLSLYALGAVYRIIIAKYLTDVDYGRYVFASTYSAYFSTLAILGMRSVVIREVAKAPGMHKRMLMVSLKIRAVTTLLAYGLACGVLVFLHKSPVVNLGVMVYCLYLFSGSVMDTVESMIIAKEASAYITISSVTSNLIKLGVGWLLLARGHGLLSILALFAVVNAINAALSWYFYSLVFRNVKPESSEDQIPDLLKFTLRESLPFFYVSLISRVYYKNDVMILSLMKGDRVVGWYGVAYLPIDLLLGVAYSIISAGTPVMARLFSSDKDGLRLFHNRLSKYIAVIFMGIAVGLTAIGPEMVVMVFGRKFAAAAPVLRILAWMPAAEAVTVGMGAVLAVAYEQRIMYKITIINAVINLALCFVLIWRYSYLGAAVGTVVSAYITQLIVAYVVSIKVHKIDWLRSFVKPALCAAAACAVVYYLVVVGHSWLGFAFGLAVYVVALLATKTVIPSDYKTLKSIFRRQQPVEEPA